MNSIFTRRSVRSYLEQRVEKEKIEQLLKAAMQAPSAANQRPWEFIVVEDKARLQALAKASQYAGPVKEAPLAIVVLGNKAKLPFPENRNLDLSAATQNLMLEAVELGLGTVWLGIAPVEERMQYVADLFQLPPSVEAFAIIAVGYPKTENKFVDRYEQARVHYETY